MLRLIMILFIFTASIIWGENFLIDQDESARGSVVFPYLNVKKKASNNLSGLVKEQHFQEARDPSSSWSSDFSRACEQRNQELCPTNHCCRLFCSSLPRTALAKGRKAPRKYVHRFLGGSEDVCANSWLWMILLFERNLIPVLGKYCWDSPSTRMNCQLCSKRSSSSNCGRVE